MMKLSEVLSAIAPTITYQRSTKVNDEWENKRISLGEVKASQLPPEGDETPPVIYNMWVNTHATTDSVTDAREGLAGKGLRVLTTDESIYVSKSNGSCRFMIVGDLA